MGPSERIERGATDLTLNGSGMPAGKPVPKVLKVTGNILGSQLEVSGGVGLVKAAGFRDSTLWAGYTAAGGFTAPVAIKTFRVTGRDGAFANS